MAAGSNANLAIGAPGPLDQVDAADDEALRVDAVDAGGHDDVADLHVGGAEHVLELQRFLAAAHDHALRARPLDQGAHGGVAVDEQLHLGSPRAGHDDPADDAFRRQHGHVGPQTRAGSLADGHGAEVRRRRCGDDLGRRGDELDAAAQLEQARELAAALGQGAFLLQPDLRIGQLLPQSLVFVAHAAQVHVAAPERTDRIHGAGAAALQLGDQAKGDRLQHGHARLRRDLCRDQDDVRDDDEHEQDGTAAPPMLEHGHGHQVVQAVGPAHW